MRTRMDRNTCLAIGCLGLAIPRPASAAGGFGVVGFVSGGAEIGGVSGTTLYGVVPYGGSGAGTLFKMEVFGPTIQLHDFAAGTDGSGLVAHLVLHANGDVIGIASSGGQYGGGTLWQQSTTTGFSVLHPFGASGDGSGPLQGPVGDRSGNIFGTTSGGAVATNGLAFRYAGSTNTYTSLHDFLSGADGHCPFSGAARGAGALLYGTTVGNGFGGNPNGSVWEITYKGQLVTLYTFTNGADGEWPHQTPLLDNLGNIYGSTSIQNGNPFAGALWKISPTSGFSMLHSFVAATDGAQPNSPLIADGHGTMYGTTATGGPGGYGTVFSITQSGTFTVLHAFANGADGGGPTGSLVRESSGFVFGGTQSGQVFRIVVP